MARGRKKGCLKSGGRRKGTPNKLTAIGRAAFADFVDGSFAKFIGWVTSVANDPELGGPAKAADLYLRACEFAIPKLARTEVMGAEGEPLRVSIAINGIQRDRTADLEHAPDVGAVPRV